VFDPLGLVECGLGVVADAGLEALVLCLAGCARGEEALLATLVEGFDKLVEEGTGPVTW